MRASRVREWLRRYGPAEVLSLLATVGAAAITEEAGGSNLAIALAATWAGNLAYFGLILGQDVWRTRRQLRQEDRAYTWGIFGRNVRALVVEFGAAEALDSLLIRPTLMYWLPLWLHSVPQGVLLAKFAADVTFYVPAIIGYELSKKKLRKF
ncbi:MAG: hypothetical protein ACRYFV_23740 [Janthinobacterium lividum]